MVEPGSVLEHPQLLYTVLLLNAYITCIKIEFTTLKADLIIGNHSEAQSAGEEQVAVKHYYELQDTEINV